MLAAAQASGYCGLLDLIALLNATTALLIRRLGIVVDGRVQIFLVHHRRRFELRG